MSESNQKIGAILLVDDDAEAVLSLSRALKAAGVSAPLHAHSSAAKALDFVRLEKPPVCVIDLSLVPNRGVESGFTLLKDILAIDPSTRVIVLTGHASTEFGVRALKSGAANFLEKPANPTHLAALITDGVRQAFLMREYERLKNVDVDPQFSGLIGKSAAIAKLRDELSYAAQTAQPVMICGETGTGKGLCAAAIHRQGTRASKNFVRYQPSFASADLVNSELFGHVRGAFTGASADRRGLLAEADGGTLFLDEIDQLPLDVQVTLLGALQDKKFRAVGASVEQHSQFRLICASNADIEGLVQKGLMRKDFFHRIAHFKIFIPPLRERLDDVADLAAYALKSLRDREQLNVQALSAEALQVLTAYQWPGNVRELEAVIEGAAYRAQFAGRFQIAKTDLGIGEKLSVPSDANGGASDFHTQVEQFKLKLIEQALASHQGNQVKACEALNLDRSTMRRILERKKVS